MRRCQTRGMSARWSATEPGFVGRAEELAAVRTVVQRACNRRADALLVQGDAGVGKTELMAHALADAGPRTTVVRGAALPLTSMTVPCLPLRSAVARLAVETGEPASRVFDGPESSDGAPLAFDRWVSARCSTGPLVLAVDDLQWADESTLDVLMYLLAGPRDRALAVLLTLRRGEIREGHRLNRWLADVHRLPGFQAMTLEPFDRHTTELQIARLVGAPPHQSLLDDVVDRARGNAYLTRLLVAGLAPETRHLPDALPTDLETAVLAAWHRLTGPARDLTKVIAIGGRAVSATELAKFLAGESGFDDVGALLREAEAAAVLDPAPDGTYWFHHPLQAEALQRRVPDHERRSWHARFAARLEDLAASQETADVAWLASIADHHHHADHPAEALTWARRAAAAAGAVGGTREQVRLLHRAVALCGHAVDGPSRVDLLRELQDAAARGADHDSELDAIEDLLATTSDEDEPLLRAELLIRRCHLGFSAGRAFMSLDDIEQALRLSAEQPDSWQHAWALAEMAHVGMWADDERRTDFAAHAIAAARRAGHPRALSYANTACAILATFAGRDDEGLAFADAGRRAAIEAEDYWAYVHASSWEVNCIAPFTTEQGATHAALRRRELQTLGAPHPYVAKLAIDEADGWVAQGRWELAAEPLRIALGANPGGLVDVQTRLVAARLAAFQGRIDEALAHLQRADEICDSSAFVPLDSDIMRAEVMLAAGDPEAAFTAALHGVTKPVPPTLSSDCFRSRHAVSPSSSSRPGQAAGTSNERWPGSRISPSCFPRSSPTAVPTSPPTAPSSTPAPPGTRPSSDAPAGTRTTPPHGTTWCGSPRRPSTPGTPPTPACEPPKPTCAPDPDNDIRPPSHCAPLTAAPKPLGHNRSSTRSTGSPQRPGCP